MRYAIISDVHGNLEALEAVVQAVRRERADAVISLGDIVGYGADPAQAIALVRSLDAAVSLAGNHEWGVLGKTSLSYFNAHAARAVEWTRSVLGKEDREYLEGLPLTGERGGAAFVHGSLDDPAAFNYILSAADASLMGASMRLPLAFVGHSHVPGIYALAGAQAVACAGEKAALLPGRRYVVNAGSVGQPRDGDPRAAYAVYDDTERTVEIRRVSYDVERAQEKILRAGLPAYLAHRLGEGA